jgi:hypothetical protein
MNGIAISDQKNVLLAPKGIRLGRMKTDPISTENGVKAAGHTIRLSPV